MLVRLKNGIDEAIQAEQIDDDGEGCCWLGKHGESGSRMSCGSSVGDCSNLYLTQKR